MGALPKFSVGEVVILQSTMMPELNGEDVVVEILTDGSISEDRIFGGRWKYSYGEGFHYKLKKSIVKDRNPFLECEGCWLESSLRKKQEPGEMSFMQLMNSLNFEEKV